MKANERRFTEGMNNLLDSARRHLADAKKAPTVLGRLRDLIAAIETLGLAAALGMACWRNGSKVIAGHHGSGGLCVREHREGYWTVEMYRHGGVSIRVLMVTQHKEVALRFKDDCGIGAS